MLPNTSAWLLGRVWYFVVEDFLQYARVRGFLVCRILHTSGIEQESQQLKSFTQPKTSLCTLSHYLLLTTIEARIQQEQQQQTLTVSNNIAEGFT